MEAGRPPGSNLKLKGRKGTNFEGGVKTACIMRWPEPIKPDSTWRQPVLTFDLARSMLRVAGADLPDGELLDGLGIVAHMEPGKPSPDRPMFGRERRAERRWREVRDGDWKYVSRTDDGKSAQRLFDLASDPNERQNLSADVPAEAARLRLLLRWERKVEHDR